MRKKTINVALVAIVVMVAAILASSTQIVSAAIPAEMKMPVEPGFEWDVTCGYDGTGGGICGTTHTGKDKYALDFNLPGETDSGRSVRAVASGTAVSGYKSGYGNYVDVDHGDGYISRYAHLQDTPTVSGYIMQGTEVGKLGNSGGGDWGSHLHFVLYHKVDEVLNAVKPEPMSGYPTFVSGGGPYYSDNYGDIWHFNTPNNFEGWTASGIESGDGKQSVESGAYFINPERNDPYIYSAKLSLDANHYDSIEINMASNAPNAVGQIYFTTSSSSTYSDDKRVEFYVTNNGNWQTYTIYMANHNQWQGTITGIRIDPAAMGKEGTDRSDTIGFDWIKVVKTDKKPKIINTELSLLAYQLFGINFGYWIENPFANDLTDVRLGAQIRNCCTNWADDPFSDRVVTLVHNSYTRYERWFKPFTNLDPGFYDAHWVILNHKTGVWYDDKEKTNAFIIEEPSAVIPDPTSTPTPTPAPTSPPSSPPSTPTPTPSPNSETIELNWHIEGADGSAGDSVVLREGILLGKESVTLTYDTQGLCLLGSDASAIAFEQGEWRFISLSNYGENCKDGEQTVTIPLTEFKDINNELVLDPNAPIGQSFIARIWHEGPFAVDIYRVRFNAIGESPTPTPTPGPTPETIELNWHIEGADGSAGESVVLREGILLGKESVTLTYNTHGLCLLGSDASAIAFEQGEWRFISLSNYGENCKDGEQTETIPLTEFKDINNELVLDPNAPIGPSFIARIWHEGPFAVDIYRVRFNP